MSTNQTRLVVFATGLFLLSLIVYRWEVFTHFYWTILLFKVLVPSSFLMICYGLGRFLRIPSAICLALPFLVEIICWQYIAHVIRVNKTAAARNIGVLDQWIAYRDVIQYNSRFSSFSPDLSYTLRPGSEGYHADLEYKNRFTINSQGLRDDEISLQHPGIIFLGDSFTMGWGVDREETFEALTEKRTGMKSLNAGVSSYGTFREMLLLRKLQRDSCKVLVIQYCDNDLEENIARNPPRNEGQLLTREKFEKVAIFNRLNAGYYPMRFTYFFVREKDLFKQIFTHPGGLWRDLSAAILSWTAGQPLPHPGPPDVKSPEELMQHSAEFFKVLVRIRELYKGNIVIMHLDGRYTRPELINAFESGCKGDANIYFLRASDLLTPHDYYPVDGHLNAAGHQKIAAQLSGLIKEKRLLEKPERKPE